MAVFLISFIQVFKRTEALEHRELQYAQERSSLQKADSLRRISKHRTSMVRIRLGDLIPSSRGKYYFGCFLELWELTDELVVN